MKIKLLFLLSTLFLVTFLGGRTRGATQIWVQGSDSSELDSISEANASLSSSLNLDGVGDYISIADNPALNPFAGITIEAWVLRANISRCETVVGKGYLDSYWLGFCSEKIRFYTNGIGTSHDGNQSIPSGQWTHIAVTYDGTTRRYYINGMLDYESVTPGPLPLTTTPLNIGADAGTFAFSGNLAEVRLWNHARNQEDIRRDLVRVIEDLRPGLIGVWHLETNELDAFNQFENTLLGDADFTGLPAPVMDHDPIEITRDTPINVDGTCSASEYPHTYLPIWYEDGFSASGLAQAYVVANASNIYVCLTGLIRGTQSSQFAAVYIDPDDDGGSLAQQTDYRISASMLSGTVISERGNGVGGYESPGLDNFSGAVNLGEFTWSVEFRFDRKAIPSPAATFRMQFMHHWLNFTGDDYGWPVDYDWNTPDPWATFMVNDANIPRPDGRNPTIETDVDPGLNPLTTENVTITATGNDDVDVARIDIFVDGRSVRSCLYPGDFDETPDDCIYEQFYSPGNHTFYARVVDHRGRLGFSPLNRLFIQVDGEKPIVSATHAPLEPALREEVTIQATATDPSGIRSMSIGVDGVGLHHDCPVISGATTVNCSLNFRPTSDIRVVHYQVIAQDEEGLWTYGPRKKILFGNNGPDSDGDGLSDQIERLLCTSASDLDTDRDALNDGWEVLGLHFDDGDSVDLPGLGANPCRKEVFFQLDYEEGLAFTDREIAKFLSIFREIGLTVHLTLNERPKPEPDTTCDVGDFTLVERDAQRAAAELDENGDYYFDPKLNWTHIYGFKRYMYGRSAVETSHYIHIDVCWARDVEGIIYDGGFRNGSDVLYNRLVHEFGHALRLWHGGSRYVRTVSPPDGRIYYWAADGGPNWKPNHFSIMNYRYGWGQPACWNPTLEDWNAAIMFSEDVTGLYLNESSLPELNTSDFVQNMRERTCEVAGYVPVFSYTCFYPGDDNPYFVVSDGEQTVARRRAYSRDWQTDDLPNAESGVDWNCDGTIELSVQTNVNGDGADKWGELGSDSEELIAYSDTEIMPAGHVRLCSLEQPLPYRQAVGDPECLYLDQPPYVESISSNTDSLDSITDEAIMSAISESSGGRGAGVSFLDLPDDVTDELTPMEVCDGWNNDLDDAIDEGCPDADGDGIVDGADTCPQTVNSDQADLDKDGLGDVCQNPTVTDFYKVADNGQSITLAWNGDDKDVLGFSIYRKALLDDTFTYLGDFPTTANMKYQDSPPVVGAIYLYELRPVNLNGQEGPGKLLYAGAGVNVHSLYLPAVLH